MNKFCGVGRLTADPEITALNSGVTVCKFTVAIQRKFKNADGERETDFFNCQAWRKTGDFIAQYFAKGQMIAISGTVQNRKWQDKEGNNRISTDIVVEDATFCGGQGNNKQVDNDIDTAPASEMPDQDLPF